MMDATSLAAAQLRRMRGMNRYYHERFFADVRFVTVGVTALFVIGWWSVPLAFLLIPPLTLIGAAQTAFDASYLIFSRHYAERLERYLNQQVESTVLIAHELENEYLFPLSSRKIVTAALDGSFSWFGFMTLFYTALGVLAFGFGLALGWPHLIDAGTAWVVAYLASLGTSGIVALVVGWWWFVAGVGERRLSKILDERLPI
jgi:hypothetical protein